MESAKMTAGFPLPKRWQAMHIQASAWNVFGQTIGEIEMKIQEDLQTAIPSVARVHRKEVPGGWQGCLMHTMKEPLKHEFFLVLYT